jgi:hypothetical protein
VLLESLGKRVDNTCDLEVRMTEASEKETIDLLMSTYDRLSKSPSVSVGIDQLPIVKMEPLRYLSEVLNLEHSTIVPMTLNPQEQVEEKRGRGCQRKKPDVTVAEPPSVEYAGSTDCDNAEEEPLENASPCTNEDKGKGNEETEV